MTAPQLTRHLLTALAAPAAFLGVAVIVVTSAPTQPDATWSETNTTAPANPATELLVDHDCWTGPGPAAMRGQIPGHVVVTLPGDEHPTYAGPAVTADALEQLFDGVDHHLTIWGFCR